MNKVKIELDHEGVRSLLRSDEMENECRKYAEKARSKLSSGYEVTTRKGSGRANASIHAESAAAKRDNKKNNSILKAVFGE